MRSDSPSPPSERTRKRWPALVVAFGAALGFRAVLDRVDPGTLECCEFPTPQITVTVEDEDRRGVRGARVSVFDLRGGPHAIPGDTLHTYATPLLVSDKAVIRYGDTLPLHPDTLPPYRDTLTMFTGTTSTSDGWMRFYPRVRGYYRLTLTPPHGWVVADSSSADTTVYMDSAGVSVRFVLRRAE